MNRTIIAVYGRSNEGKSTIVKKVCQMLIANFAEAIPSDLTLNLDSDILATIQIGEVKIGIESQGDPQSRMFQTLEKLAIENCDIIVCTTRTRSGTVQEVDRLADNYDYETLWISSWYSTLPSKNLLNHVAAKNIVTIIELLIADKL